MEKPEINENKKMILTKITLYIIFESFAYEKIFS